jgi:hypothetical protein
LTVGRVGVRIVYEEELKAICHVRCFLKEENRIMKTETLSPELLRKVNAYWRAANYLSVGQIYLYDNPLLNKPLKSGWAVTILDREDAASCGRRPELFSWRRTRDAASHSFRGIEVGKSSEFVESACRRLQPGIRRLGCVRDFVRSRSLDRRGSGRPCDYAGDSCKGKPHMDQLKAIENNVAGSSARVSSVYVPPFQLTQGQPPPIAANGGLRRPLVDGVAQRKRYAAFRGFDVVGRVVLSWRPLTFR